MLSLIKNYIYNQFGFKTNRKIIVIESDDWGGIRMKSKEIRSSLKSLSIDVDDPYNSFDALASEDDLSLLFEVLSSFKDKKGTSPKITANVIVANPNFQKIKEANFEKYYYEIFTDTIKTYSSKHTQSFALWKEGIKENIFHPQFHGREHVNVYRWLERLKESQKEIVTAFDHEIFGIKEENSSNPRNSYMRALDFTSISNLNSINSSLVDGLSIFEKKIGYKPKSFIAPSYVWGRESEALLSEYGVEYLQGIKLHYYPVIGKKNLSTVIHYTGQKNKFNQTYLVRNAFFEPSLSKSFDVSQTLQRIDLAFKYKKPAIIGSHRLNYIGFINEKNRDTNLKHLGELLQEILKRWPDVEFMTSDQLGDLITKNK